MSGLAADVRLLTKPEVRGSEASKPHFPTPSATAGPCLRRLETQSLKSTAGSWPREGCCDALSFGGLSVIIGPFGGQNHTSLSIMQDSLNDDLPFRSLWIKSSSATAQDSATRIPQLFGRIPQLGFCNWDSETRIPQLGFRN